MASRSSAVQGSGRARRSGARRREPLSSERIEQVALELIEREGLPGFSQRALARGLGVEAMSLYHWYPSQLDLLNALFDRVVGTLVVPAAGTPLERLRAVSLAFRALALRHPSFVSGFVLPHRFNTPVGLALIESMLSVLHDAGLDARAASRQFRIWMHFLMGALLDETTGYAKGPGATAPPSEADVARRFPLVAALAPYNKASHHEAQFNAGLDAVLRGV
jgi:AcrR family transcriptional regulator